VNISGPTNELVVTADSTDETCLLNDGSAQVFVLGGVPNYDFSWTGPAGYTNTNSSISSLSPGLYLINVTDANGCEVSSSTRVNGVSNIFLPGNLSLLDTTICLGATITLNIEEKPGLNYTWDDASTDADRIVTPTESINNYSLTVTDPNCLNPYVVEAIVRVTYVNTMISSNPDAEVGNNPTIIMGDQITLFSGNNNCNSYDWSNGDSFQEITVQPEKSTWYSLTVDSAGCLGIDSIYVIIGVSPYDAISPNGDLMNDVWEIVDIESYPSATVTVFNRWGEIVHQCSGGNAYVAWDGTYEAEPLPVGTYYYVIDLNNNENPQTGPITIVR
jgi:gliding motility-associated-like protein